MASALNASRKLVQMRNDGALSAGSCAILRSTPWSAYQSIHLPQRFCRNSGSQGRKTGRRKVLAIAVSGADRIATAIQTSLSMEDRAPKGAGSSQVSITIPVSYYQVLGLADGASEEEIMGAYTELRRSEIDEAYTVTAILSRQELLEDVKAKLLQIGRRPKNSTWNRAMYPPSFFLSVPWAWLPGALVLLQEVGEEETVLKVGHAALQETKAYTYRQDIVIAMSLSKCSMARAAFEKGMVTAGFEDLVQAHTILQLGKDSLYGSKLLTDIEASLEEMAPACTLEHLSLPCTSENKDKRAGALAALVELIRQGLSAEPSCSVQNWEIFLCNALGKLSAQEIVNLLPWETLFVLRKGQDTNEAKQQRDIFNLDCLYTILIAHLAIGFSMRKPELVETAGRLADALVAAEAVDLRLEQAICATLLGQADMAFGWLTDAANSLDPSLPSKIQQQDTCQQALHFINECTTSSKGHYGDLPGLCAFTERWLQNTGLHHFSDTRSCLPSLVDYYNASEVKQYLLANGCRSMIKAASVDVQTPVSTPATAQMHVAPLTAEAQTLTSFEKIDSLAYQPDLVDTALKATAPSTASRKRESTQSYVGALPRKELNNKPLSRQEMSREIDLLGQPKQNFGSRTDTGESPLFSSQPNCTKDSTDPSRNSLLQPGHSEKFKGVNAGKFQKHVPFSYLPPSQSIAEHVKKQATLRNGYTKSSRNPLRSTKGLMAVVLLTGSAAAVLCFKRNWSDFSWQLNVSPVADILFCKICNFKTSKIPVVSKLEKQNKEFEGLHEADPPDPSPQKRRSENNINFFQQAPSHFRHAFKKAHSRSPRGIQNPRPMPLKEAEALIRHWQTVKAEALGPEYAIHYLPNILADQMLFRWQALSEEAKASSCYWRFVLLNLKVVRADITADELGRETAELEAILEEAAELVEKLKPQSPNYYSTYRAKYQLQRSADRTWRICGGGMESTM